VGAAKFLSGLVQQIPEKELTVVVNTGDDAEFHGLHVSPDLDIVAYTLAGVVDPARGWGVQSDTFHCLSALAGFGHDTWFQLGDRDLATHIHRTHLLHQGRPLSEITADIARSLGLSVHLLPMSDERVETRIATPSGTLPFQQYMVQRRALDPVEGVEFAGAAEARPAPGVLSAIAEARGVIVCPSNPIISIGTILAIPGIRDALRATVAPVVAISPIVAGAALKGPAVAMMRGLGYEPSAYGVASLYRDFVDAFIIDVADADLRPAIAELGMQVIVTNTVMGGPAEKSALAAMTLKTLANIPVAAPPSGQPSDSELSASSTGSVT
jgi:LPPG:FO 2-phospho-L-lactate transferase